MSIKYRGYTITYEPKSAPTHHYDYEAVHDDYDDGEDSGDELFFCGESVKALKSQIDEYISDSPSGFDGVTCCEECDDNYGYD